MNMSAECAFCFLIKLKNSRYFRIIKSLVSLFNRTANKYLISNSSVHGLNAKLSQGLNLPESLKYGMRKPAKNNKLTNKK